MLHKRRSASLERRFFYRLHLLLWSRSGNGLVFTLHTQGLRPSAIHTITTIHK